MPYSCPYSYAPDTFEELQAFIQLLRADSTLGDDSFVRCNGNIIDLRTLSAWYEVVKYVVNC